MILLIGLLDENWQYEIIKQMAGYIFNLDSTEALRLYTKNGVYSTKLTAPRGYWTRQQEGTFADYVTMKPGDNIYFFIEMFQ